VGPEALHGRLAALDPTSARRIHPRNLPRIIRALEIVRQLGGPVPPSGHGSVIPAFYLGLSMERDRLHEVADRRVLRQVDEGLLEETQLLLQMGYEAQSPGLQGFGYRQMLDVLARRSSLSEGIEAYQVATHRYIRRQLTWFRADSRIVWLDAGPDSADLAATMVERWLATAATPPSPPAARSLSGG
jgi:tRNA dimethylallyltransferase